MKIYWNPSPELKEKAVKISILKENASYSELARLTRHTREYVIELVKLGRKTQKEREDHGKTK